jgi:hypothetical protein
MFENKSPKLFIILASLLETFILGSECWKSGSLDMEWPYPFLTPALEGGVWAAPRPGRFTPGNDPVPITQEAGWVQGPVWMCAKNLAPTGIQNYG